MRVPGTVGTMSTGDREVGAGVKYRKLPKNIRNSDGWTAAQVSAAHRVCVCVARRKPRTIPLRPEPRCPPHPLRSIALATAAEGFVAARDAAEL